MFSTMTGDERKSFRNQKKQMKGRQLKEPKTSEEKEDDPELKKYNEKLTILDDKNLPKEVDWVQKKALNPVMNQNINDCGSCWSMSSIAAIEAHHFIKTGELLKLSEQQVIECAKEGDNCEMGGDEYSVFEYAMKHGIELNASYPYQGLTDDKTCKADDSLGVVKLDDYHFVQKNSSAQLKAAIA